MEKIFEAYQRVGDYAELYDEMMTNSGVFGRAAMKIFWGLDDYSYRKFLKQTFAGIPEDFRGRLLEVPVGTGVLSLPQYEKLNGAEIFCVDLSDKMLAVAEKRAKKLNLRSVKFIQSDVIDLPFTDKFFDAVLSINGFHVFGDKVKSFEETRRVLKDDGIFCGSVYIKGENTRTDLFVEKFCEPQGFFNPPYDTAESLRRRLSEYYSKVEVSKIKSFAGFVCVR
ncbi:MAG: class I SAM-dependent methyltransferase [Selenomonadaceae bacterium]|nr:class I SAM-dependent methyltransferase [Selenomonadaceae bacterium]